MAEEEMHLVILREPTRRKTFSLDLRNTSICILLYFSCISVPSSRHNAPNICSAYWVINECLILHVLFKIIINLHLNSFIQRVCWIKLIIKPFCEKFTFIFYLNKDTAVFTLNKNMLQIWFKVFLTSYLVEKSCFFMCLVFWE